MSQILSQDQGSVAIPITLQYQSSGVRVDEQATWVGLSWNLAPEGTIIQEIRGKADEVDQPIDCAADPNYALFLQRFQYVEDNTLQFHGQWGRELASNTCLVNDNGVQIPDPWRFNYKDPYCVVQKIVDGYGQPDIYNYNFNGQSGKFYINPTNHQIVVTNKTDQIYFAVVNQQTITATTLDGTVYTFGTVETASADVQYNYTGKTYKMSRIDLLNGRFITFAYATESYVEQAHSSTAELLPFTGPAIVQNTMLTYHTKKRLTQIVSTDAIVNFNASSRDDINVEATDNVQKLASIDVLAKATNQKVKSFQFTYTYFPYSTVGGGSNTYVATHEAAFGKRLRLDKVQEVGYDALNSPVVVISPYEFQYDLSVTMPLKVSNSKDFWGYYNGANNTSLLPDLDYFDFLTKDDYRAINTTLTYPYVGANRYSDNSKAGAYLLKKVIYPTKGYTSFDYESNTFTNQFIPDQSKPFKKNLDVSDNSVNSTPLAFFKLSKTVNIHVENRIFNGFNNPNNVTPLTYSQMQGCYIELTKVKVVTGGAQITVLKRWDLTTVSTTDFQNNHGKTWFEDVRVEYDPDPNPYFNYRIEVVYPDNLNNILFLSTAGVSSHLVYQDDTGVDITKSTTGGMRIARIRNYADDGTLASDKAIHYFNGKLLSQFRPLTAYPANYLDNSGVTNGIAYEYIGLYRKITVSESDFGMAGGPLIGYDQVDETELSQGASSAGKRVFSYYNMMNITSRGCFPILNQMNGLISFEEVYNNANVKLQQKQYMYSALTPFPLKFLSFSAVRLSTGSKVPCENITSETPFTTLYYPGTGAYMTSQYGYNISTLNAEWRKLSSMTTKMYENGAEMISTVTYTYDSEGKVKTETTTNSKGESLQSRFFYPTDHTGNASIENAMIEVHQTSPVVKTDYYKNSTFLSGQRTSYKAVQSLAGRWPENSYTTVGANPEELRLVINGYDDKGNVTQYTEANNVPVTFVWNSDKTLPVAKVENATYATLLALPGGLTADFRTALPNARVTTFQYKSLIGVSTITDPNNKATYFQYDPMGRLTLVRDWQNRVLKKVCYNYAGQVESCIALP